MTGKDLSMFHMIVCLPHLHIIIQLILLPPCRSISFDISHFSQDTTDILLDGDAGASAGMIDIISEQRFFGCRVGRAIFANKVRIWDANTNQLTDFTTQFTFSIDTFGAAPNRYGSGLAFFLAPVNFQIPPNSMGGFLGLFNISTMNSIQNQIVAVEFDSFKDPEWDPADLDEHVGININSISSVAVHPWNASQHSRDDANAWISYNATTKNLSVFWSYPSESNFGQNSSLSYQIDLRKVLPEWVIIGFSATTGRFTEQNHIKSWKFYSSLTTPEDDNETQAIRKANVIKLVVGLSFAVLLLVAGVVTALKVFQHRRMVSTEPERGNSLTSMNDDFEQKSRPRSFSYEDLASATDNFAHHQKLGAGGFGSVYKGQLVGQDATIAVKQFSKCSNQGRKEFINEIKVISQLRHRNLVQLIGWCHDQDEFLLVYEYMANGSLDQHLFSNQSFLPWLIRYKITLGMASALLYHV